MAGADTLRNSIRGRTQASSQTLGTQPLELSRKGTSGFIYQLYTAFFPSDLHLESGSLPSTDEEAELLASAEGPRVHLPQL